MNSKTWFDDVPVLAEMPSHRAAALLREVGETDMALALEQTPSGQEHRPASYGAFDFLSSAPKPWMHAAHTFGFLPLQPARGKERRILSVGEISPDQVLKNGRVKISLNRLRVAA